MHLASLPVMPVPDVLGRVASPNTIVPAAGITALLLRRRDGAARLAIGTSIAFVATEVLKRGVSRRRPRLFDRTPWRSFPSGHSAASAAHLPGLAPAYRPIALAAACLGAAGVNALRVQTREHWPSDVVAGDLVAIGGIAAAHLALRAVRRRRHPSRRGSQAAT
jgi:membrane-associated phospholipid phosphatase